MLSEIQHSHPLVYQYFSKIQHGDFWLKRIMELDCYWSQVGNRPAPEVIFDGSTLPKGIEIAGEFDAIYAGATLGLLHAAALTDLFGKRVLIIDKYTPAKTHRDWNISLRELQRLDNMGFLKQSDTEQAITKTYKTGFVEFAARKEKKRLFIDHVLDCAIESDILLQLALNKVLARKENVVLAQTVFKRCWKTEGSVVVEVVREGTSQFFKAKVLVDTMGVMSPIAMQLNSEGGVVRPQTHICPTVGTLAGGLE